MVGVYLKNNDVFKSFSDWLDNAIKLKGGGIHPLTAHVTSFIKSELSKEKLLEHSINVFLELVNKTIEKKWVDELMPISLDLPKIETVTFGIYYRCFRDSVAIEYDWEFNKVIYLECYTSSRCFPIPHHTFPSVSG